MAYKKQPLRPRICMHCGDPYEAVDRRRLYCRPSCKTLASIARRKAQPPKKQPSPPATSTALTPVSTTSPALLAPAANADNPPAVTRASLGFDRSTIQVNTVGTILGIYSVRAFDKLFSEPAPKLAQDAPRQEPHVLDPASWFPAAVLSAPALAVPVHNWQWLPALAPVCVQLVYFGRRFYYHPAWRCLWWECGPGQLWRLNYEAEFTRVFTLPLPELDPPGTPTEYEFLH